MTLLDPNRLAKDLFESTTAMSFGCDVVVSSVIVVGRGWEGGRRLSGVRSCGTARETGAREVIAEGWRRERRGMRD